MTSRGERPLETALIEGFTPGEGLRLGAARPDYDDSGWLETSVPGDVHRALLEAGRIPDPFYDRNEDDVAWVEHREWWYRLEFDAPTPRHVDDHLFLRFEGLDTYATVWLNGQELGSSQNMFREAVFPVTDGMCRAKNLVAVRFDPPLTRVEGLTLSRWGRNPERAAMRKAQFGFGWDWGPRLPTVGIWRPVQLVRRRSAALEGLHVATVDLTADRTRAAVAVRIEGKRFTDEPLAAEIRLSPPHDHGDHGPGDHGPGDIGRVISVWDDLTDRGSERIDHTCYLTVEAPRLWWTHDLGTPNLYDLDVRLVSLTDRHRVFDHRSLKVGLRTLTLDQSPDPEEPGTRFFRFVLNGVPLFARGANWIPCDSFLATIPEERYVRRLEAAQAANMNMLRVWGGGIYEHDRFYELCDQLGILVWQDFMFACAMYPEDDPSFVAEVDAEARYQTRRLRSHPCLAVWCGNNEVQWLHEREYWDEATLPPFGELYFDHLLPKVVNELDNHTPYWPGSPYGGDDHASMTDGNRHNWEVWHGNTVRRFGEEPVRDTSPESVSYQRYAQDTGRFITEFGIHAAPSLETLRRALPSEQLRYHSDAMDHHNKDAPKNKGDNLMATVVGLPKDLQEYVDFSQITQAEGLKFGIEHYRRRAPHCSGTLVWQLNDCWPALSWSLIDYYGFEKAGYFAVRRAYTPVLASFAEGPTETELWITNGTRTAVDDTVTIALRTFTGEEIQREQMPVRITAGDSRVVWRRSAENIRGGPDRYLSVRSVRDSFPPNRHFFVAIKDLHRAPAEPLVQFDHHAGEEVHVTLTAPRNAYAYFVHLTTTSDGTRYSDNYFDLEPSESREVVVTEREGQLSPASIRVGWR